MNRRTVIIVLAALFVGFAIWANTTSDAKAIGPVPVASPSSSSSTMSESELFALVRDDSTKLDHLVFQGSAVAVFRVGSDKPVIVTIPDESERTELKTLARNAKPPVKFDSQLVPEPGMGPALLGMALQILLPIALLFFLIRWMMKRGAANGGAGGGAGGVGLDFAKHRGKTVQTASVAERTMFVDVTGQEDAKQELQEVVDFLKHPEKYLALGAELPRGVLLYGPPGTGKTLLARAVAGEAGVPFLTISGSEFVEMFVGVGASRVRDLFKEARQKAPCIVFVDEIDAVGRSRGGNGPGSGSHNEQEQTLNQILVEMDGFDKFGPQVIVIAATNRPDVLDPALLRPGRFTRQVGVELPDFHGREVTHHQYGDPKPHENIDWEFIARATAGMSQADIKNVWNEAAILAARYGQQTITMDLLDTAISKQEMGAERRSMKLTEDHKINVAIHEGGHALGHWVTMKKKPRKITIIPTQKAAGYVQMLPEANKMMQSLEESKAYLVMALCGRTAQVKILGVSDTGASNDFQQAWNLAYAMVAEYGWSKLGVIHAPRGGDSWSQPPISEALRQAIEHEVRELLDEAQAEADRIIEDYQDAILLVKDILLEKETILGGDFVEIMENHRPLAA